MKLSQGEYVALERIENTLSAAPIIAQIFVYGHSLQSYLLAVVIPDPVNLARIASNILGKEIADTDTAALDEAVKDERVVKVILGILTKEGKKSGFKGYEHVRRIHVSNELFSMENGTLTPTFKIKRKDAAAKYQKELDALYALGEPQLANGAKL
jgi:long-chain acyl-CoA synthetase